MSISHPQMLCLIIETHCRSQLGKVVWVKVEISIYWPGIPRYGLKIWVWGPYTQLGNRGILPYLPILQMRSQLGKVVWVKAEISIYWPGIAWYGLKISETVGYYVSNPGIWSHFPLSQLQPDTLGQIVRYLIMEHGAYVLHYMHHVPPCQLQNSGHLSKVLMVILNQNLWILKKKKIEGGVTRKCLISGSVNRIMSADDLIYAQAADGSDTQPSWELLADAEIEHYLGVMAKGGGIWQKEGDINPEFGNIRWSMAAKWYLKLESGQNLAF
ncbi:hypothetical protein B0H10DRAFT_1964089 [Mycena sp. CBHHK59/15]|nr:hypothetical protein B0H10DRAFT_1964089 [Mycena sp. CBHHK59/15]